MLKKLLAFAITSGLAVKLYKTYAHKKGRHASPASADSANGAERRRSAQK